MGNRAEIKSASDRQRQRDDIRNHDIKLLCLFASCIVIAGGKKIIANEVAKMLLPGFKLKKFKRVARLVLVLTRNRKQKSKPRQQDLKAARDAIAGAKQECATSTSHHTGENK